MISSSRYAVRKTICSNYMPDRTPELFDAPSQTEPLAARMRPRTLDELVGQDHILGPGRLLRRAIAADQLSSLILSGPPGSGKTTIARIIANTTKSRFAALNAVLTGVEQLRKEIQAADTECRMHGRRTILFVDEVHRWNKAQQDALLPWVENGTVILIGATTENPFFEVNSALVSRSRVFQLTKLTEDELRRVCRQALNDKERGYGGHDVRIDRDAIEHLVAVAAGDARSLLNAVQLAVETTPERFPPSTGEHIDVTLAIAEESIQRKALLYDRDGDYHYDSISAFIKSVRGSDPDAALYWLARMIRAGEDPKFLFRRMLISASEDVGLADPHALPHTVAAAEAFDRVGMPEGAFHLSQAALYLAAAEKSNSAMGYFDAVHAVEHEQSHEVPRHLRDGSRDHEALKHGEGYLYPHAYREHWVAQNYLPTALHGRVFYRPSERGYEGSVRRTLEHRREAQLAAAFGSEFDEVLTYSPPSARHDHWLRRASGELSRRIEQRRAALFEALEVPRHYRVLVLGDAPSAVLWEAARAAPEGLVAAVISNDQERRTAEAYGRHFSELVRPQLFADLAQAREEAAAGFELVVGLNVLLRHPAKAQLRDEIGRLLAPGAVIALLEDIPAQSSRLSGIFRHHGLELSLADRLAELEQDLYSDDGDPRLANRPDTLQALFQEAGYTLNRSNIIPFGESRCLTREQLERWFPAPASNAPPSPASYAGLARSRLSASEYETVRSFALNRLAETEVGWSTTSLRIVAEYSAAQLQP